MLHVDVLSGYTISGAASLVGAAMLRIADTDDDRASGALRTTGLGFVVMGLGLICAALPTAVAHVSVQFVLPFATLIGMLLVGSGLGALQGRGLAPRWVALVAVACAVTLGCALAVDARDYGTWVAAWLAATSSLMVWLSRGMIVRPRDAVEGLLGASIVAVQLSCLARFGFTLADDSPARLDVMYVPEPWRSVLGMLYGVLPMVTATLLLTLINSRLRQQLRLRATTDELTGALTRRALRELAPALIERHLGQRREVAVLMLDLDRFKDVNDTHGHHVGDAVLRLAARALQGHTRVDTLLARYGGEEFVAVVPVEDLPAARRVAERLRHAVEGAPWRAELKLAAGVTTSVGVAIVNPAETLDAALTRADEALYRAKREGRNCCQVALERA